MIALCPIQLFRSWIEVHREQLKKVGEFERCAERKGCSSQERVQLSGKSAALRKECRSQERVPLSGKSAALRKECSSQATVPEHRYHAAGSQLGTAWQRDIAVEQRYS